MPIILAQAEPPASVTPAPPPSVQDVNPGVAAHAPVVVKSRGWARKPSGSDIGAVYPAASLRKGLAGRVVMSCKVEAAGTLRDCAVVSEDPMGAGFGEAALRLRSKFQMNPIEGVASLEGGVVRIPVHFVPR